MADFDGSGKLLRFWGPNGTTALDPANVAFTGGAMAGVSVDGLATAIPLVSGNTGAANAVIYAATVSGSGRFSMPGTGSYAIESSDIPGNAALIGTLNASLKTSPITGKPWGLRLPQANNNQLIDRVSMSPASGAATHDGLVSELMNGVVVKQPSITGYTGAASIRFANATAMRIDGGQFGNASDVAVALNGATNDSLFTTCTVAYPKYIGYYFGPGGQANAIIGGETAVQDGGVPIIIDRSNGATIQNHNTESQSTGGTPGTFYVIGCGTDMVGSVAITAAGSGYTNGTHYLTATGGTGNPPCVTATVSGGAVTAVNVTSPGYGIVTPWTLAMPTGSGGTGATFSSTLGTTTGTHNTHGKNLNIIANKGFVANVMEIKSPFFNTRIEGIKVNATKITNSIFKFFTVNGVGEYDDINVSGRAGGVVDIQVAPDATYLPAGASYTTNGYYRFAMNKGVRTLLVGPQARSAFPTGTRAALRETEIAPDANIAPYLDRVVKNGATYLIQDASGQVTHGNGTDTGQPWRHYGPLSADPTSPVDGDTWFRTDTFQYCYRTGGLTKRSAAFT